MTLVRRTRNNVFPTFPLLFKELFNDDFVGNVSSTRSLPAVNIKEDEQGFELELIAPGLKKEDFKIEINQKLLTISSEVSENQEESRKMVRIHVENIASNLLNDLSPYLIP